VGHRASVDAKENREISLPLPGIELLRFLSRPTRRLAAIPAELIRLGYGEFLHIKVWL
jgi:hypothetical protein